MKRCTFYKCVRNPKTKQYEAEEAKGWEETAADEDGHEITVCLSKNGSGWTVTEKSTGFLIDSGTYPSREKALEILTPYVLRKIHESLKTPPPQAAAVAEAYKKRGENL